MSRSVVGEDDGSTQAALGGFGRIEPNSFKPACSTFNFEAISGDPLWPNTSTSSVTVCQKHPISASCSG